MRPGPGALIRATVPLSQMEPVVLAVPRHSSLSLSTPYPGAQPTLSLDRRSSVSTAGKPALVLEDTLKVKGWPPILSSGPQITAFLPENNSERLQCQLLHSPLLGVPGAESRAWDPGLAAASQILSLDLKLWRKKIPHPQRDSNHG